MMINFNNLTKRLQKINFSLSNPVYHTCSFEAAIWDLENDCIDAKLRAEKSNLGDNLPVYSDSISPEWRGVKFVSVTTNLNYVIAKQYSNRKGFVRFALDLNKLEQDFDIKDWEFFKSKTYLDSIKNKPDAKQKLCEKFGKHDCLEYEKRIIGKLFPLSKYLVGVDIFKEDNTKDIDIKLVKLMLRRSECSYINPNIIKVNEESYTPEIGSRFIQ